MRVPKVPDNEPERLSALHALHLLDTPPEERFDRLTRLARQFFAVETAMVTLVDDRRQWFKSRQGMDMHETERAISFCGHAILQKDIFEIQDATQDERFFDNPLVTSPPHVRFYAGVPLSSTEGLPVGTLCLMDSKPNKLDSQKRRALLDFAASIEAEIGAVRQQQLIEITMKREARGEAIACAESHFLGDGDKSQAFKTLLEDILRLTDSEAGLIAELTRYGADDGYEVLTSVKTKNYPLSRMEPLITESANTGQIVVSNAIADRLPGSRIDTVAPGSILGAPAHHHGRLIAVVVIASDRGYDKETMDFLQPLVDTTGQLVSTLQSQREEAERRRQAELLARVAENTDTSVVITDTQGRVEWVNNSFTRITGYSLEEVLGHRPGEVLQGRETDPDAVMQMHQALQSCQPFTVEVANYTKSGRRFWMRVSCDAMINTSGEHEGFIAVESDVTDQKEAELKTRELLDRLEKLTENLPGMVYQYQLLPDGSSRVPYASRGLTSVYGAAASEVSEDASAILGMIHPEDRPSVIDSIQHSADNLSLWEERFRLIHPAGKHIWIEGRATPERLEDGSTLWHGFLADITERKQLEQAQQEQAAHTQAILDNVVDGIVTIDAKGTIDSVNQAIKRMFGYSADEVIGKNIRLFVPRIQSAFDGKLVGSNQAGEGPSDISAVQEMEGMRKSGDQFPLELAFSKIFRDGMPVYIGVIRDISERKENEKEINRLAYYDPLTLIPNRRLFYARLEQARAISKRSKNYKALLLIDLDNFKRLNDTAGHYTGDRLLKTVAKRITSCVEADDTVARLGGDEFVVLLENLGKELVFAAARAEHVGERILRTVNLPYPDIQRSYNSTSSIGVTLFCGDNESAEELHKKVDMAMYQAKVEGKNRIVFFDPFMQDAAMAYVILESELRSAIHEKQFELFYQIQVDSAGTATGAEALVRWHHPVKGCIGPSDFIPLAEDTRLVLPIGNWVLETACQQIVAWAARPETENLTIAVNVSALQISEPDFVERVEMALEQSGANPKRLKLELTETLLASDIEVIIAKMTELRKRGVSFALDDFGTGYSSLSYLKRMPIDQLKIDQSFIRDIHIDRNDKIIARSIMALAKSLELAVIAEGVETEEHRNVLVEEGCLAYQGYLFGRPVRVGEFEQALNR